MATATKTWSKAAGTIDETGNRTYIDGYHIIDAATRAEAMAADGLPVRNDPLEVGSPYKLRRTSFAPYSGPTQWLATAEYGVPPNGSYQDPPEDPLLRNFTWEIQPITVGRANETDAYRIRKTNSAGDLFPPQPAEARRRRVVGRRYETFWNVNKSRKYEGKTNANVMTLGPATILPYECLCISIEPTGTFEMDSDYLLMEYVFELAIDERASDPDNPGEIPAISGYPFDAHYADVGSFGWYSDGAKVLRGRFCYVRTADSTQIVGLADDVLLDGTGKPIDTNIRVCDFEQLNSYAPVANPTTSDHLDEAWESPYSTDAVKMWLYFNHQSISFADIFDL